MAASGNPLSRLDGYERRRLPAHLAELDEVGQLQRLLCLETVVGSNAWFEIRDDQGEITEYVADAVLLEAAAGRQNAADTRAGRPTARLGAEVFALLCRLSVNSLARGIPRVWFAALARRGLWPAAKAIAYARRQLEPRHRVEALTLLAGTLSEPEKSEACRFAVEELSALDLGNLAFAVHELAPHVNSALRRTIFEQLTIKTPSWDGERVDLSEAFLALAAHLSQAEKEQSIGRVLDLATQTTDSLKRADILNTLGPHLPPGLQDRAVRLALDPPADGFEDLSQSRALLGLVEYLSGTALSTAIEELHARLYTDIPGHLRALAHLLPDLPEQDRAAVCRLVLGELANSAANSSWNDVLRNLAPILPPDLFPTAIRLAEADSEPRSQARNLLTLAVHHPPEGRDGVTLHALDSMMRYANTLTPPSISGDEYSKPAVSLIGTLGADSLSAALAVTMQTNEEHLRVDLLVALVPRLVGTQLDEALASATEIKNPWALSSALCRLVPILPDPLVRKVWKRARDISQAEMRAKVLAAVALRLSPPDRLRVEAQALVAAKEAGSGSVVDAVTMLAPHMPADRKAIAVQTALQAARTATGPHAKTLYIARLVPLAEDAVAAGREALEAALEIVDDKRREDALVELEPLLSDGLLAELLPAVQRTRDRGHLLEATVHFLPYLPTTDRDQTARRLLKELESWPDPGFVAWALPRLAVYLSIEQLHRALTLANRLEQTYDRAAALAGLVGAFTGMKRVGVARQAKRAVRAITAEDAFVPVLGKLSRQRALALRWQALPVARAWVLQTLVPHLAGDLRRKVLTELISYAEEARSSGIALDALTAHAADFPARTLSRAVALVLADRASDSSVPLLAALRPVASKRLLQATLERALAEQEDDSKGAAHRFVLEIAAGLPPSVSTKKARAAAKDADDLAALSNAMPEGDDRQATLADALDVALRLSREHHQTSPLAALLPMLDGTAKQLAADAAVAALQSEAHGPSRAYAISKLAPHLPRDTVPEALQAAVRIEDSASQREAVGSLAHRLAEFGPAAAYGAWGVILSALPKRSRRDVVMLLSELLPLAERLGDREAVRRALDAVEATSRWWP
jgi:hypothetical protein